MPSEPQTRKRIYLLYLLLFAIGLLGIFCRVYRPEADPPSWGYVFNTDEGHYSYNTHNKLKYGAWFVNEAKYALITPLFSALQYAIARPFAAGSELSALRLFPIIAGILSLLFLFLSFKNKTAGVLAATLGAVSFIGIVHSRMGITEVPLCLFMQSAVFCLVAAAEQRKWKYFFASGFLSLCAGLIKPTGLLTVCIVVLPAFLSPMAVGERRRYLSGVFSGLLSALVLWSVFLFPHREDGWYIFANAVLYGKNGLVNNSEGMLRSLFFTYGLSPAFQTMPFTWGFAIAGFLNLVVRTARRENRFSDAVFLVWFVAGSLLLGLSSFQPARWQVIMLPPVIYGALSFGQDSLRRWPAIAGAVALSLGLSALFHLLGRIKGVPFFSMSMAPPLGIFGTCLNTAAVAAAALFAWVVARALLRERSLALLSALFATDIFLQLWFIAALLWPTYGAPTQWAEIAGDLSVISARGKAQFCGDLVQDIALRSDIDVLPTFYTFESADDRAIDAFFRRQSLRPDHFLMVDFKTAIFQKRSPRFFSKLELVKSYRLRIGGVGMRNVLLARIREETTPLRTRK